MLAEVSPPGAATALRSAFEVVRGFALAVPSEWIDRTDLTSLRGIAHETRSVRELVSHMAVYERHLALPAIRHLAGLEPVPNGFSTRMTPLAAKIDYLMQSPFKESLEHLEEAVRSHATVVEEMDPSRFLALGSNFWNVNRWGVRESAAWITSKSVEHLFEHGFVIARVALFHDVLD